MSIKSKVFAAVAALTLVGGVGSVAALSAGAATPSCGNGCIDIFSREYAGQSLNAPQYVLDIYRQGAKLGQPVILFRSSNTDPAEDVSVSNQGPLSDFYAAGLVSSSVALHYGCSGTISIPGGQVPCSGAAVDDTAFELQYSPYGVDSGLCIGVAATASAKEGVSLQPCGVSGKTVWIQDTNPGDNPVAPYYAAINGSDTNFSHPFVLTYPANSVPTDKPRAQLFVSNLTGFSAGVDNDNQLFTGIQGVLP